MRLRKRPLSIERLERRDLFASFGVPWPEIDSLRISFVPDGTQIGNARSELFHMLDEQVPEVDWQLAALKAFQTWAVETNANVGLVEDQGQPIGTLGFKQGDLRFGDVRIGAFPMEKDVLAIANPYDPFVANTWVGDVFINSSSDFLADSSDPFQSLLSVMIHEAGHVYGLGHSTNVLSPMYPYLQKENTTLTADDIAQLQAISGEREADRWEGETGNQTLQSATQLSLTDTEGQSSAVQLKGDISSLDDVDTYSLIVPEQADSLNVDFNPSGMSLLTAKLVVLNEQGEPVSSAIAVDPRDNHLSIVAGDVHAGQRYSIQIQSADKSVFGIGHYALTVTPQQQSDVVPSQKMVLDLSDLPVFAAEELMATTPGYVEHTYYELAGTLDETNPSQRFRFHSPILSEQLTNVFTIILSAELGDVENLDIEVTDYEGNSIPMSLIAHDDEKWELQVTGVAADTDYVATIFNRAPNFEPLVYELEVDFAHDGRHLETLVSDSLTGSQPSYNHVVKIEQSGHYHFVVSGSDWSQPQNSGLLLHVLDESGNALKTIEILDGGSQWLDLFLDQGTYTFQFTSPGRDSQSSVLIQLAMESESSPIGPQLRDLSSRPVERLSAPPIDALIARWLPGYSSSVSSVANGKDNKGNFVEVAPSAVQTSVLYQRGNSLDAEVQRHSSPKLDRTRPKRSEIRPAPWEEQQEVGGANAVELEVNASDASRGSNPMPTEPNLIGYRSDLATRLIGETTPHAELAAWTVSKLACCDPLNEQTRLIWQAENQGERGEDSELISPDSKPRLASIVPDSLATCLGVVGIAVVGYARWLSRRSLPGTLSRIASPSSLIKSGRKHLY